MFLFLGGGSLPLNGLAWEHANPLFSDRMLAVWGRALSA